MVTIPVHKIQGRSCKAKGRSVAVVVAHAIVDDEDARLVDHFWTLHSGYAVRRPMGGTVFMHHDVIGKRAGLHVSHDNANKLDNRRSNLRHVSVSENMLNVNDAPRSNRTKSPYRGVSRDVKPLLRPWRGKVTVDGVIYQTARYETPEQAKEALEKLRTALNLRVRQAPWKGGANV